MDCNPFKLVCRRIAAVTFLLGLGLSLITACNTQSKPVSDEELRQQTANATEKAKQQSREALQDARIAAGNAEQKVDAIAAGVRQGINSGSTPVGARTSLNGASRAELEQLPGISEAKAGQIIRHRPYTSTHQLVDRGILSQEQFEAISSDVTTE